MLSRLNKLAKGLRAGQKGFTLIELLIVVAILGILAAVIIPNVSGFMTTGKLNAANTEVENVKTAALAYAAENDGAWPPTDSETDLKGTFIAGTPKANYTFDADTGFILTGEDIEGSGWGLTWEPNATGNGKWTRGD